MTFKISDLEQGFAEKNDKYMNLYSQCMSSLTEVETGTEMLLLDA